MSLSLYPSVSFTYKTSKFSPTLLSDPLTSRSIVLVMPETKRLMYGVHNRFFSGYINPKISSHFSKLQFTMVFVNCDISGLCEMKYRNASKCRRNWLNICAKWRRMKKKNRESRQASSSIHLIIIIVINIFRVPSSKAFVPCLSRCWWRKNGKKSQTLDSVSCTHTYFWININTDVTCKQCALCYFIYREY